MNTQKYAIMLSFSSIFPPLSISNRFEVLLSFGPGCEVACQFGHKVTIKICEGQCVLGSTQYLSAGGTLLYVRKFYPPLNFPEKSFTPFLNFHEKSFYPPPLNFHQNGT